MRVTGLEISNFRNIKWATADKLPNLVLLWGGNGSGKSAILEAVLLAKEAATEGTQAFLNERNIVAADSNSAQVRLVLEFSPDDIAFARNHLSLLCPREADIKVTFQKGHKRPICNCHGEVRRLLAIFSLAANAPGYFDYFPASRRIQEQKLNSVNLAIPHEQARNSLTNPDQKFSLTKQYLSVIKIRDLDRFKDQTQRGLPTAGGPIDEVKGIFARFFAPMRFVDVDLHAEPIKFAVQTASGEIDIDDLSSGEKEVLHVALRFTHMRPRGSVILFDEPDAHLHPDLATRYCRYLQEVSANNQIWIATHSPDQGNRISEQRQ